MHSTPHLVSDTFPPSQVGPGGGATIYIYIYMSMISDKSTLNISLQKGSTIGASLGLGLSFAHLQSFLFDSMLSLPFKQAQVVKINPVLFVQRWTTENPS